MVVRVLLLVHVGGVFIPAAADHGHLYISSCTIWRGGDMILLDGEEDDDAADGTAAEIPTVSI
jgi:hypothetical protein